MPALGALITNKYIHKQNHKDADLGKYFFVSSHNIDNDPNAYIKAAKRNRGTQNNNL